MNIYIFSVVCIIAALVWLNEKRLERNCAKRRHGLLYTFEGQTMCRRCGASIK